MVFVAVVHVAPLSVLTFTTSPVTVTALNVPLIVCAAVLVMKSVLLVPVSALNTNVLIVVAGATVSST